MLIGIIAIYNSCASKLLLVGLIRTSIARAHMGNLMEVFGAGLALALAMFLLPYACYPREDGLTVWVGENRFEVDLAITPEAQQRGLMYRDSLALDEGMLFIQPHSAPARFWMKNMKFALDILYFDGHGRLLEIHSAVPPCPQSFSRPDDDCPLYESAEAIAYILELRAGTVVKYGIKRGDRLVIGTFGGTGH